MLAVPVPSDEETEANSSFEALLWAMSRPGEIRALPQSGVAQIIHALIDRECKVFATDAATIACLTKTGAAKANLEEACHAFLGTIEDSKVLHSIRTGSDFYPDDGATVILDVSFGKGQRVRFSGPGIEQSNEQAIDGLPRDFWQVRAECLRYPMGFELILVDGANVLCIPRSTKAQVI